MFKIMKAQKLMCQNFIKSTKSQQKVNKVSVLHYSIDVSSREPMASDRYNKMSKSPNYKLKNILN